MHVRTTLRLTLALIALSACDRSPTREPDRGTPLPAAEVFSSQTEQELALARQASSRYHDLSVALADGYVDIHVVMQHMGYHFMNPALLDGTFRPDRPQILVYAPEGGRMRLVAVEYAVPLSAPRPEGFTGSADVWDHNTGFGLWLLHAWVWKPNPSGMFAPFNPNVVIPGI